MRFSIDPGDKRIISSPVLILAIADSGHTVV